MVKIKSDQQLAEEVERDRDSIQGWESGPIRAKVRKNSTVVFSLRLSADELEVLRDRAASRQMTVSDVIRESVFTNAFSVSIQPVTQLVGVTGVVSTEGITAGSGYGGFVSATGICNLGPYYQEANWNNTFTCSTSYLAGTTLPNFTENTTWTTTCSNPIFQPQASLDFREKPTTQEMGQ